MSDRTEFKHSQEKFKAQCTSFAGMEQSEEAKASNGERNLSKLCIAVETVSYKDTSYKRVTSDSILEQRREHSGAKQLGSRGEKKNGKPKAMSSSRTEQESFSSFRRIGTERD